jgi:tRNA threonylcarbamoyladenosine biosynthesis protein TsaE
VSEVTLYLADEEAMTTLAHASPKPRGTADLSRRRPGGGQNHAVAGHHPWPGACRGGKKSDVHPGRTLRDRRYPCLSLRPVSPGRSGELEFLGIRDYFEDDALCLIEWPDKGAGFLPKPDLTITISPQDSGRSLKILPQGSRGESWCAALALESNK